MLLLLSWLLLAGCSVPPSRPPNVSHQDAHGGGNLVAFDNASSYLASGGWEGGIKLWRLPDGSHVRSWAAHTDSVEGIAFVENDRRIMTAGYDASFAEWTLDGTLIRRIPTISPITDMVLDEAARLVVTGHADGRVRLWNYPALMLASEHALHKGPIMAIAWHGNTRQLASSGEDGRVFLWQPGQTPTALPSPPGDSWTLVFSPDGRQLTGSGWLDLYHWDIAAQRLQVVETDHGGIITALHYSGDGQRLASISRQTDSAVLILDAKSGVVEQRLQPHDLCGGHVRYSPNGRFIATTSDDASVRIWDLQQPLPDVSHY
jgi:WD40 repeat protein